jgi:DNA modification methylase
MGAAARRANVACYSLAAAGGVIIPVFDEFGVTLYHGDCREVLRSLPDKSINCCVTSPPYWGLRDYGTSLGMEPTPAEYVAEMVGLFSEVRRVLAEDGTLWLNLGDSYETKQLIGIPWRVAFALQADGWLLRSDIIWHKPNPMPESVTDRPTKAHEYVFLLAKNERYYYDAEAIREENQGAMPWGGTSKTDLKIADESARGKHGATSCMARPMTHEEKLVYSMNGRNKRSVWTVPTSPFPAAHFATFPPKLIEPCIKAGCPVGGAVLDPFFGAGTTGLVCQQHQVKCIGIELNAKYCTIAARRLAQGHLFAPDTAKKRSAR